MIRRTIKSILFFGFVLAQPELRFHPFDWVQYRHTGKVNSITFGDRYAYIGTQSGGVLRFNRYSERFDEPITRAQGLQDNTITAVHRSSNGQLWVATQMGVELSFNEEGDWQFISRNQLNFPLGVFVERIGESKNNVWLDTPGLVYKLDAITGIVVGVMPNPDEAVTWSSGLLRFSPDLSNLLIDFSFMDGWMTDLQSLIHPDGRQMNITTLIKNKFNEVWIGTEDGTFFRGDNTMKTFTPYRFSLAGNDIQTIRGEDSFWLGGRLGHLQSGITYFDIERHIVDEYLFNDMINMDQTSVFSIIEFKKEVWFGGEDALLVYNKKKDFWRTFGLQVGGRKSWVTSMVQVEDHVWVGSPNGISILKLDDKKPSNSKVEKYFRNIFIYDLALAQNQVWIGTETGFYIYDIEKDFIRDYRQYGYKNKDVLFPLKYTDFTAFTQDKHQILVANRTGILSFNFRERKWSNAVDPSIFGGLEISAIILKKNTVFIATDNGIIQYDLKKNQMDVFNYSFIGHVNDMYIKGRRLWLGTSEGLISYRYK
ncbi:MAG: two-component regulator propeller domain-containing protein [Candidatus Marinimicrobia bacterium]|nr:two-component regulator propeller domain-containing protein [Candidatus Neomarinimicrobiota bacterium]